MALLDARKFPLSKVSLLAGLAVGLTAWQPVTPRRDTHANDVRRAIQIQDLPNNVRPPTEVARLRRTISVWMKL